MNNRGFISIFISILIMAFVILIGISIWNDAKGNWDFCKENGYEGAWSLGKGFSPVKVYFYNETWDEYNGEYTRKYIPISEVKKLKS